jgi:hypothetical protein
MEDRMMATIDTKILDAALEDGYICKKLTPNNKLYLHFSVITANLIYQEISNSVNGLDSDQLKSRTELHTNTIATYCRGLSERQVIVTLPFNVDRRKNLYFIPSKCKLY